MQKEWTKATLAKTIDHTLLKAIATEQSVRELCVEARKYGFASVCVNPFWVELCAKELSGSGILVCTVDRLSPRRQRPRDQGRRGPARRLPGRPRDRHGDQPRRGQGRRIGGPSRRTSAASSRLPATRPSRRYIETCYLNDAEKVKACEAAARAGARFVKTSTGFGTGGASAEDVRLMRKTVGDKLQVKASGGIRSYHDAIMMLDAGADRIGASSAASPSSRSCPSKRPVCNKYAPRLEYGWTSRSAPGERPRRSAIQDFTRFVAGKAH